MKKYLALLLALTISAGLFTSCGSKDDTTSSKTTNNTSTVEKADKIENALTGEAKQKKLDELNEVAGRILSSGVYKTLGELSSLDLNKINEPIDITITGEDAVKLAEQENRMTSSIDSTEAPTYESNGTIKWKTDDLDFSKKEDVEKLFKCAIGEYIKYSGEKVNENYTYRLGLIPNSSATYNNLHHFHIIALCSEPNVALIGATTYYENINLEEFHKKTAEITDINSKEADEIFTWGEENK